jgi:hypothetical protein
MEAKNLLGLWKYASSLLLVTYQGPYLNPSTVIWTFIVHSANIATKPMQRYTIIGLGYCKNWQISVK